MPKLGFFSSVSSNKRIKFCFHGLFFIIYYILYFPAVPQLPVLTFAEVFEESPPAVTLRGIAAAAPLPGIWIIPINYTLRTEHVLSKPFRDESEGTKQHRMERTFPGKAWVPCHTLRGAWHHPHVLGTKHQQFLLGSLTCSCQMAPAALWEGICSGNGLRGLGFAAPREGRASAFCCFPRGSPVLLLFTQYPTIFQW